MKGALSCSPLSLPFTLSIILLGGESSLDWFLNKHKGNAIRKKFVKWTSKSDFVEFKNLVF